MILINEDTRFEIIPYVGTNSVKFGFTQEQVADVLGQVGDKSRDQQGKIIEYRSYMNVAYSSGDAKHVVHIGFGRQMKGVHLGGINLFLDDASFVLRELIKLDGDVFECLGFLVFFKLGISLTGFHDADDAQKAVSVFPQGDWDSLRPKMKKYV